jgi:hypothetical protein
LDRISGFDPDGCRFEPCWSHLSKTNYLVKIVGFLIGMLLVPCKKNKKILVSKNFKTRIKDQSTLLDYNSNNLFKEFGLNLFSINAFIVGYKNIDTVVVWLFK